MSEFILTNGADEITFKSGDKAPIEIEYKDGSELYQPTYFYLSITQCQELVNFLKNKIAIHHKTEKIKP
jgi:hypothetical protein